MFSFLQAVDWGDLIQPALATIIQVLLPVVLGYLVLWFNRATAKLKAEISNEQLAVLESLAAQFVLAAEQSGLTNTIEDLGEAKKAMVIDLLQEAAKSRGIKVNVDELSALIEAAVVEAFGLSESK